MFGESFFFSALNFALAVLELRGVRVRNQLLCPFWYGESLALVSIQEFVKSRRTIFRFIY